MLDDRFKFEDMEEIKKIVFNYNWNQGSYEQGTSVTIPKIEYKGNVYKFLPATELNPDATNFFTKEDIDFLITLRDKLGIEAFPFKKSDGTVTYLFLNKDWLIDIATRLLVSYNSFQMFYIIGSTLFINGNQVDYKSQCQFVEDEYGKLSYTIPVDKHESDEIVYVSMHTKLGCRVCVLHTKFTNDNAT